ncbi:MAG TPA: gamma-glutamyltransferase [Acetobacteraceae bacterium]|nr:gamma-glutamyltransferase [Acetobacteraceae bacterium]
MTKLLPLLLLLATRTVQAADLPATEAEHGMVVTAQRLASEVGADILRQGGNAIDAAVAIGYAEAVVNPCCGNIGGGGFLVAHLADGRDVFLDFRETAPAAATRDMYLDATGNVIPGASLHGWRAVAVPGTVLGLDTALARFGTLARSVVMAPAIRLAREGFVLTRFDADILHRGTATFRSNPQLARIFLRPDGAPLQPGDRLVQPQLAATMQAIAAGGPDAFYRGDIPHAVAAASHAAGGIITAADFASYRVAQAAPISCAYRGYVFLAAPPPSSGGVTLCEILQVLQGYDMRALGFHSAASVHVMVEAMRHAYFDRNTYLGDPAFVTDPLSWLLSAGHAAEIRAAIGPHATPSRDLATGIAPHEQRETTHFSVVDQAGNAVSVTYTLNGGFGAGVMAGDTGFLLNDEMDDFTTRAGVANLYGLVQGQANAIAPGKRPLSSMAPTIVLHDGRVFLVLGSPGGSRIISIVLETALNIIDYGMAPQEAVDAPRLHHQWLPDTIFAEPYALSPDTEALLRTMGYHITQQTPWGAAELIEVAPPQPGVAGLASSGDDAAASRALRQGFYEGANDARRPAGAAAGY